MATIPQHLTAEEAAYLTDLLKRSRCLLSDAASPAPIHTPNYASLASEIEGVLANIGADTD